MVEYEYYDEHGNQIDPADIREHHIIVDEEEADPEGEHYTEAELAEYRRKAAYSAAYRLPVAERLYAQRNLHKPLSEVPRPEEDEVELDGCTFRPSVPTYERPPHAGAAARRRRTPLGGTRPARCETREASSRP